MKKFLFVLMATPLMISCSQSYYYQVFQVNYDNDNVKKEAGNLKYQNEDCTIAYDFWSANGNPGFWVINNSDKNIYIDLGRTHFVRAGVAYDYFLNREIQVGQSNTVGVAVSKSMQGTFYNASSLPFVDPSRIGDAPSYQKAVSATGSNAVTNSSSVSYKEKEIVSIPPKSGKYFSEYIVANMLYFDCDLKPKPQKKGITKQYFDETNTPLTFGNVIAYTVEGSDEYKYVKNSFYIELIEVLPENKMFIYREKVDPCKGAKGTPKTYSSKYSATNDGISVIKESPFNAPNRFYIKYNPN